MHHIGESRIYVIPELSIDNKQWINPDFGGPDLRTHYDNIRQMVRKRPNVPYRKRNGSAKTRPPKLRDALPYVKKCCLSSQTVTARQNHRQGFQVVPDVQGNTANGKVLCHARMTESLLGKKETMRCSGKIYSEQYRRNFDVKDDILSP